jgi:hypothetical protein
MTVKFVELLSLRSASRIARWLGITVDQLADMAAEVR